MLRLPNADIDSYELDELEGMTRGQIEPLIIGDLVKLVFRIRVLTADHKEEWHVERMWVKVSGNQGDLWIGQLDNDPCSTDGLKSGDQVVFMTRHVLDQYPRAQA